MILLDVVMEDDESGFRLVRLSKRPRGELPEYYATDNLEASRNVDYIAVDITITHEDRVCMTLFTAVVGSPTFNDILRIEENSKVRAGDGGCQKVFLCSEWCLEMSILELAHLQFVVTRKS